MSDDHPGRPPATGVYPIPPIGEIDVGRTPTPSRPRPKAVRLMPDPGAVI
jgi:hypothetical protein